MTEEESFTIYVPENKKGFVLELNKETNEEFCEHITKETNEIIFNNLEKNVSKRHYELLNGLYEKIDVHSAINKIEDYQSILDHAIQLLDLKDGDDIPHIYNILGIVYLKRAFNHIWGNDFFEISDEDFSINCSLLADAIFWATAHRKPHDIDLFKKHIYDIKTAEHYKKRAGSEHYADLAKENPAYLKTATKRRFKNFLFHYIKTYLLDESVLHNNFIKDIADLINFIEYILNNNPDEEISNDGAVRYSPRSVFEEADLMQLKNTYSEYLNRNDENKSNEDDEHLNSFIRKDFPYKQDPIFEKLIQKEKEYLKSNN